MSLSCLQVWADIQRGEASWLSLIDNNYKLSNCFISAESRICNTPLVGLILNTFRLWWLIISYIVLMSCKRAKQPSTVAYGDQLLTMWNYITIIMNVPNLGNSESSHWLCQTLSVVITWVNDNDCWRMPVTFYWQYKPFQKILKG